MSCKGRIHPLGGGLVIDTTPVRFEPVGDNVLQTYKVPAGVKKLLVECAAAKGFNGGAGGKVNCVLNVKPGQVLYIYAGRYATSAEEHIYNASDVRTSDEGVTDETSLKNRLIVAGAGGAYGGGYSAGVGGGLVGGTGNYDIIHPGLGGSQTAGGSHSYNVRGSVRSANWGNNGLFGLGGSGPYVGGSGWYGGGSGGWADVSKAGMQRAGGGGGSSYTHPELCTDVAHTQGGNTEVNGYVILTPIKE